MMRSNLASINLLSLNLIEPHRTSSNLTEPHQTLIELNFTELNTIQLIEIEKSEKKGKGVFFFGCVCVYLIILER